MTFQETFKNILGKIASEINMVLLISRSEDLLPFVTNYAVLEGSKLVILDERSEFTGRMEHRALNPDTAIPSAPELPCKPVDPLILLKNVSVSYSGKPILRDINWRIRPGEFWQLAGRNGSGKTTILSMITGDNPKGYGQELYIFGRRKGSGETVWDIKRQLGYFTPAMIDRFRGYHSLEHMLISGLTDSIGLYLRPTEAQIRIANEWLHLLGLEGFRDTYFHDLSTGMQRLVMCARAMIKHPPLLILDEPTAGLDDNSAALFVSLVNKFALESSTAIVFVSHRAEPGLRPNAVFQLEMSARGSVGNVLPPGD
jgi:molybdate transport system ATP-binding protein